MQNLFPLQTHQDSYYIDSRLVAQALGLNHSSWMTNVFNKYLQVLENQFGNSILKMENPIGKGGRPKRYVLLSEDQAIFLATLSRNTERVVNFKVKLVKSFQALRRPAPLPSPSDQLLKKLRSLENRIDYLETHQKFNEFDILGLKSEEKINMNYLLGSLEELPGGSDTLYYKMLKKRIRH